MKRQTIQAAFMHMQKAKRVRVEQCFPGYCIEMTSAKGDCMFDAIAKQLVRLRGSSVTSESPQRIRKQLVSYIRDNFSTFCNTLPEG